MELVDAYTAYRDPLISYANKLGADDSEGLVHDAFMALLANGEVDATYSWLMSTMRFKHYRAFRKPEYVPECVNFEPSNQHHFAMLGEVSERLAMHGDDGKAFIASRLGSTNAEIGDSMGITRQAAHQKIKKVEKAMAKYLDGGVDGAIILKARQMCAESKVWGQALESGILGGQCDNGSMVQDFVPLAELALLEQKEEVCDE